MKRTAFLMALLSAGLPPVALGQTMDLATASKISNTLLVQSEIGTVGIISPILHKKNLVGASLAGLRGAFPNATVSNKQKVAGPRPFTAPFPHGNLMWNDSPIVLGPFGPSIGSPVAIEQMGRSRGLSYADFGIWIVGFPAPGQPLNPVFYAAGAQPLSGAQLPTKGNATYTGSYIAERAIDASKLNGPMSINAHFGTNAISGTFGGPLNVTGAGTINRSSLNGEYNYNLVSTQLSAAGVFYGPKAQETSGTFAAQVNGQVNGSFGARRH